MAITPDGHQGKTIQFKRTSLAYDSQEVNNPSEDLNYGEPLYNDNDKTLSIGGSASTSTQNLKVFKALDRNKANAQVFTSSSSTSTTDSSGFSNLYNEANTQVYIKDKVWENSGGSSFISIGVTATTYEVNPSNPGSIGTVQGSSFVTLPCVVKVDIPGMKSSYTPTIGLNIQDADVISVDNVKKAQKAFSCISRIDTADGFIGVCFWKKPESSVNLRIIGG